MQLNLFSQSLNDVFPQFSSELPLVSYQIGETSYTSMDSDSPIKVSFETLDYGYGLKATVTFENCSDKEVMLHNIVPAGRSDNRIYITGKGYHGLSRTHLFRPGYQPVNVTVPDNAWELGFSVLSDNSGKQYAALTRRKSRSASNCRLSRFENFLNPGGKISFNLWMDTYEGEWQKGLQLMFQERFLYDVEPGEFDNSMFNRKDQQWMRDCYAVNLMMNWDERFYDYTDGKFHVKEHLDKMKRLMGGYEIYGIWPTWPALGMDQRNQWDMFRDLPGGYAQLKKIADECHEAGTKFFLCYNPWDESTRSSEGHFDGMTTITREVGIDGFVLDTRGASSRELQDAVDIVRPGVIMYSEGMAVPRDMQGIPSGRVHNALYYCPMLNLNKLIKPDFAIFRVAEEHREPIRREFNVSFFNGYGTEINSFGPGRFEWSDDQMRYWGKLLRIQRENKKAFQSFDYRPLVETLEDNIYVNEWPAENKTVFTVYSLLPQGFDGRLFEVQPEEDFHFVDVYAHEELNTESLDGKDFIRVSVEPFHIKDTGTNNESSVTAIVKFPALLDVKFKGDKLSFSTGKGTEVRIWAGLPSYEKSYRSYPAGSQEILLLKEFPDKEGKFVIQLFEGDDIIDERVIFIAPGTPRLMSESVMTEPAARAPKGMVTIPAGIFRCDHYMTGDSFIPYPEALTAKGETVEMKKFYMDEHPVTNRQYKEFINATGYKPADEVNFLKHWENGEIPEGMENFPVIYVTLEDAQAYAAWAGKRLPTEMEWQYAAQTEKGNEWPWIQKTPVTKTEDRITGTLSVWKLEGIDSDRCNLGDGSLYPVKKYPKGKNGYGLYDLVGCVWQLTNDVYDNTTYQYIMVRGGSYFMPSSSFWYIQGGPRELNFRQYLLRVSPSFERKATVGFRCVKDAE